MQNNKQADIPPTNLKLDTAEKSQFLERHQYPPDWPEGMRFYSESSSGLDVPFQRLD
jgi:hypothetical protein